MRQEIDRLLASHHFDSVVCDFLTPAVNFRSFHSVLSASLRDGEWALQVGSNVLVQRKKED
jgi:hypothetical protein